METVTRKGNARWLERTKGLLQRSQRLRDDYDRNPLFDGDLDTPGTVRFIQRYGASVNSRMARKKGMRIHRGVRTAFLYRVGV